MQRKYALPLTPDQNEADVLRAELDQLTDLMGALIASVDHLTYRHMRNDAEGRLVFERYEQAAMWMASKGYV